MALPAFDTHAYVKRLKDAGFDEKQAEAQSELQAEILSNLVTEKLATKEDIAGIKSELRHLNWMLGFLLTGMATLLFKVFLN